MHTCSLCKREVAVITQHHLTPKEEGGKFSEKVPLCQPCHSTIHRTFSNKELAGNRNSIQALVNSEELSRYLKWIKKQDVEYLKNK